MRVGIRTWGQGEVGMGISLYLVVEDVVAGEAVAPGEERYSSCGFGQFFLERGSVGLSADGWYLRG